MPVKKRVRKSPESRVRRDINMETILKSPVRAINNISTKLIKLINGSKSSKASKASKLICSDLSDTKVLTMDKLNKIVDKHTKTTKSKPKPKPKTK